MLPNAPLIDTPSAMRMIISKMYTAINIAAQIRFARYLDLIDAAVFELNARMQ